MYCRDHSRLKIHTPCSFTKTEDCVVQYEQFNLPHWKRKIRRDCECSVASLWFCLYFLLWTLCVASPKCLTFTDPMSESQKKEYLLDKCSFRIKKLMFILVNLWPSMIEEFLSHYVVKLLNPRQHDKTLSSISFEEEKVNFNSTL